MTDERADLGTETTRLVLAYAFERLQLRQVDLRVLDFNLRAIACYQKCGFVLHGREHEPRNWAASGRTN